MHQPADTRPLSDRLPFLLVGGLSALLTYAAILARLPLLATFASRLKNLNEMPASDWPTGLGVVVCVLLLFGGYAMGALGVRAAPRSPAARAAVLGFPLAFVALLLLTFPITSTDVYDYLFRGRMMAHYGANPFVVIPREFKNDTLLPYVAWKHVVTAYGPVWELASWAVAWLGHALGAGSLLLRLILAYKALAALGFVLCGAVIWAALSHVAPEQRWLGVYLWLWNPLVLWETVGVAHNDVWLMLPVLVAVWALSGWRVGAERHAAPGLIEARPLAAFAALAAGGLIKFVAFFFGPIAVVAALRRLPSWGARLRLVAIGGAACAGLAALAYAPFWAGADTLRNISDRRSLFTASWLAAIRPLIVPLTDEDRAKTIVAALGLALLVAGVIWSIWRAWSRPDEVAAHMLWLALWFLFVCNPWFQPWYVVWPMALAAAQPWRSRVAWAMALFCFTALVSYIVGGLLLPILGFEDKTFGREIAMTAFIYGPPLIVLGWGGPARLAGVRRVFRRLPPTPAPGSVAQ